MAASQIPFLFLHIPKTGGVTFHNILTNQFRFQKHFLYKLRRANEWDLLLPEEKLNYKVVKGHFPMNGKEFYPSNCNYFTFLRCPEKRIISHYLHIANTPKHKLYEKARGNSLFRFLEDGEAPLFDNCMTRFISGNIHKKYGEINEFDLELAIENFDTYFKHFGLLERYDESLMMLTYELGWKLPFYITLNESVSTQKISIDADTKDLLNRYSKYDKVLWEHATDVFNKKTEKYKEKLENDIITFRKLNSKNLVLRRSYYLLKDKLFRY